MTLSERAAYLRGLAEGMALDESKDEVKIINEMLLLINDMANEVDDVAQDIGSVFDVIGIIDEDLMTLEEELLDDDHFGDEKTAEEVYEIACPNCDEAVTITEEALMSGDVVCASCGERVEIEVDTDDEPNEEPTSSDDKK